MVVVAHDLRGDLGKIRDIKSTDHGLITGN